MSGESERIEEVGKYIEATIAEIDEPYREHGKTVQDGQVEQGQLIV